MPGLTTRISHDDYELVRDYIDRHDLWYGLDDDAPRIRPLLERLGWVIRRRRAMHHLSVSGLAFRERGAKLLYINPSLPCGRTRTVLAHTLAHDILGHDLPVDEIRGEAAWHLRRTPIIPELEDAARAAASILLIPAAFIESDLPVREIASRTLSSEVFVQRRLHQIVIGDSSNSILRIDRRAHARYWQPESLERTGTDSLIPERTPR